MPSPLIIRILIYIFLLFCIIIAYCGLFGKIDLISQRFCLFGLLQPLGFSLQLLDSYCSLTGVRVSVLIFIQMIFLSWFTLSMQVGRHVPFCVPC